MARRFLLPAMAVAVWTLAASMPSVAHDHRPPRATLRHGSLLQNGNLLRMHWSSSTKDGGCISSLIVAEERYPERGLPVGEGRFRAALRLERPDRPAGLRVVAREDDGRTQARRRDVGVSLRPRQPNGRLIGWTAVLRSRVLQDLYLRVTATWNDREGCKGTQRATWLFLVSAE
jgi:hypothetical protein